MCISSTNHSIFVLNLLIQVKPQANKHVWSDGITWDSGIPNYDADSTEVVKVIQQSVGPKADEKDKPIPTTVDPLSQLQDGG